MKKIFIFLLVLFLLFSLFGCSKQLQVLQQTSEEVDIISKVKNNINISVNPNIELLSVVQYLSNYDDRTGMITKFNIEYKSDVNEYFEKYKDHEAVKYFDIVSQEAFSYNIPPTLMLYFDSQLNKIENMQYTNNIKERSGGIDGIEKFISLLKDFYIDTDFGKFFNNHRDYYNEIIDKTIEVIGDRNYVNELEDYYGLKQNSYNIVLVSLFHQGGYGPKVEISKNKFDIYSIIGPQGVEEGKPVFGNEEGFKRIQRHEFSHSFINYLSDIHEEKLKKYEDLYIPLKETMSSMSYCYWKTCVNEHIVRAVTTRMAFNDSEKEGLEALCYEKQFSFMYIDELVNKLCEYESYREKYKTFEEFYPELIKVFEEYLNNINSVLSQGNILIVIPTDEESNNKEIEEYANSCNNQLWGEEIVTDETALEMDLSKYNVIVYGTMDGNKLLSKYKETFPFKLDKNTITIGDKEFKGDKIQFMTAVKNPQNPKMSFIIYTSNKDKNVIGINRKFHGYSGYHLFIDDNEVSNGFYYQQ